jgi:hypothetical protein
MLSLLLKRATLAAALGATLPAILGPTSPAEAQQALLDRVAPGSYEATLTGAATATLRGTDIGTAAGDQGGAGFVISLGAYSEHGAIILRRWNGQQPGPGTYPIADASIRDGIQVLVVTGSPSHPTGAFRGRRGSVTITSSSGSALAGRFEMQARGFLAAEPEVENRELTARGSFTAAVGDR